MKLHKKALACTAGAFLLLAATVAQAQEAATEAGSSFTAQQPPKVALLKFEDTNTEAIEKQYASSVESMLSTFLQSSSPFTVVERKELKGLYEEKRRIQNGLVEISPGDTGDRELLKKADAFIFGEVTLLDSSRIEIDIKVFTGFDSRIVATAQRSGTVTCLRATVERLGIALEQELLRLYHGDGSLEIRLPTPENVQIFLIPIPPDTASIEAPAELSSTINIGKEFDTIEPWITAPMSYTIRNLLPGWYILRLARPGYEDLKVDNRRFEVRLRSGQPEVYDRKTGLSLDNTASDLRRFVVHVDPLSTRIVDGNALGFAFRKKSGSLAPRVKRKYLDNGFFTIPQRVLLKGGKDLELNSSPPGKSSGDSQCALLKEQLPLRPDYGRTIVPPGKEFDLEAFQGGELIIEDYRGEQVPAGRYQMAVWDPNYRVDKPDVTVRDGDREKVVRSDLARETLPLTLETTGEQPNYKVILKGSETHYEIKLPLDFPKIKEQRGLPADTYKVSTNIPGLSGWKRTFEHFPGDPIPPRYYLSSSAHKLETARTYEDKTPSSLIVKTRFVIAGRLDILSRPPQAADLFMDEEVGKILDQLLPQLGRQSGNSDELRERLIRRLELVDLLLLNPRDMARLRQSSELTSAIQDYVRKGGALFAFVSEPGDYGALAGAPMVIGTPGQVLTMESWQMIAFTERRRAPKVLERGERKTGGYVALWLDDPSAFRDRSGKAVPKVEENRRKVEERILKWAKYLMYRRYDKTGKLRRQAEEALGW